MATRLKPIHIVTIGHSLALNYERETTGRSASEAQLEENLGDKPEAERVIYSRKLADFVKQKEKKGQVSEASDEINALKSYFDEINMVYLIRTDTYLHRCCARALKAYLEDKEIDVPEPIDVKGLHKADDFQIGLVNLMKKIAELVLAHRGKVRICAAEGFKPEVVVASIIGFVTQTPVYYIHECFREEVYLPALPLGWKPEVKQSEELNALIYAGSHGIKKEDFIDLYGEDTYQTFLNNRLIEEKEGYLTYNQISKTILETMQKFMKVKKVTARTRRHGT